MYRRLLISQCTGAKSYEFDAVPALQRYAGFPFPTIRKMQADRQLLCTEYLILSAKHGLLYPHTPIAHYDQKLTKSQAWILQFAAQKKLDAYFGTFGAPDEVYLYLSDLYLRVFGQSWIISFCHTWDTKLTIARGGIGVRQQALLAWLKECG